MNNLLMGQLDDIRIGNRCYGLNYVLQQDAEILTASMYETDLILRRGHWR